MPRSVGVLAAWAPPAAAQTRNLVIGYELPLTGDSSHYGEVFNNAADIRAPGVQGGRRPARAPTSPSATRTARTTPGRPQHRPAVRRRPSIIGVLGDFNSTVSMAAAEIYAKAGMPQLSQTASHPDFLKISKWQFRNITTQAYEGPFRRARA